MHVRPAYTPRIHHLSFLSSSFKLVFVRSVRGEDAEDVIQLSSSWEGVEEVSPAELGGTMRLIKVLKGNDISYCYFSLYAWALQKTF